MAGHRRHAGDLPAQQRLGRRRRRRRSAGSSPRACASRSAPTAWRARPTSTSSPSWRRCARPRRRCRRAGSCTPRPLAGAEALRPGRRAGQPAARAARASRGGRRCRRAAPIPKRRWSAVSAPDRIQVLRPDAAGPSGATDGVARHLPVVRAHQPHGVRAAVRADRRAAGGVGAAARLGGARLDPGLHGVGAQRRDGLQPAGRRRGSTPAIRAPPAANCRAAR